jgi:hypothetical protein
MRRLATLVTAGLAAAQLAAAAPVRGADDLAWMAGRWLQQDGSDWVEERWSQPRGGVMLGTSLTGRGDSAQFFEFLRLERDKAGVMTYWALPKSAATPTPFRLSAAGARSAVFVNPAHDYPQRIAYSRSGGTMIAEVALADGTRPQRWTYRLAR